MISCCCDVNFGADADVWMVRVASDCVLTAPSWMLLLLRELCLLKCCSKDIDVDCGAPDPDADADPDAACVEFLFGCFSDSWCCGNISSLPLRCGVNVQYTVGIVWNTIMRVLVWWIQMIARSTRGFFVLDKQATGRCEESRIRFFRVSRHGNFNWPVRNVYQALYCL